MTFPRARSPLLIEIPSLIRSPWAAVRFNWEVRSETEEGEPGKSGAYPLRPSKVNEVELGHYRDPIAVTSWGGGLGCFAIGVVEAEGARRPETASLDTRPIQGRTEAWGTGSSEGGRGNSVRRTGDHGSWTSQTRWRSSRSTRRKWRRRPGRGKRIRAHVLLLSESEREYRMGSG